MKDIDINYQYHVNIKPNPISKYYHPIDGDLDLVMTNTSLMSSRTIKTCFR